MKKNYSKTGYKPEQLEKALYKIEDLCDRVQIPMILLQSTAQDIFNGEKLKEADGIYLGIKATSFTPFNKSMLFSLQADIKEVNGGLYFEFEGVPVNIRVIKRNYKFFDNPQFKFYKVTEYWLPNPFETYWKARNLIA